MKNNFYNYLYNANISVGELYAPLGDLAKKYATPVPNNCWQIVVAVSDFVYKYWEAEPWYPEKIIFGLVEQQLVEYVAEHIGVIDSLLSLANTSSIVGTGQFGGLDLNNTTVEQWEGVYSASNPDVKKRVDKEILAIIPLFTRLKIQLQTVGILTALPLGPALYSVEDTRRFVVGNGEGCDFPRLIFTLREMSVTDTRHEAHLISKEFLTTEACLNNEDLEWKQAVLLAWTLGFMFSEFERLSSEDRIWLINNYFYRAIAAGVPVRQFLQSYLLSSRWVVEYVQRNAAFALSIENNSEKIPAEQAEVNLPVGLFCANYDKNFSDQLSDEQSQNGFIEGIVNKSTNDNTDFSARFHPQWLKEVLFLYSHIKEASLVDWLKDGDSPLNYENRGELIRLLAYFAYGGAFELAIKYFKDRKNKVPLKIFLQYLKDVVDLTDGVNIPNCLAFTEALHTGGLLPVDQDIVIFHEQDGHFHWNEDMSKI